MPVEPDGTDRFQAMSRKAVESYYRWRIAILFRILRNELALRSVFSPRLKVIYFCNPKVAGSTIIGTLVRSDDPDLARELGDLNTLAARRRISSEHDPMAFWSALNDPAVLKFSFVRDPYSRLLSCYKDKIVQAQNAERFRRALGLPETGEVAFSAFLKAIARQRPGAMNRHWRPQARLLPPSLPMDFIGKFEHFDGDFGKVLDRLNLPASNLTVLRGHATGTGAGGAVSLTSEEISLINRIYREDFLRFGYCMR
ncbi:hypothetical protein DDZ14_10805 [Maritimibacter sp. 55A14]|uniref:sulfotransferase family 2 domain-containing protein n=1 Tax=Maritimibacter sp. 55A14 TaxID=2174844 RepID=UPI000D6224D9|nr:sulfotransferase family 2 domain-containing protein [Maritimibacter sp. 55A14]PWE32218.1 hypothetical protein DDZ14_10805 [Maritimibacter sp. 55A14]